jgi:hypothetical protein
MGNREERVDRPLQYVTVPLAGEDLLSNFKKEIIKERVLQAMFGVNGDRVFITDHPNLNESIVPAFMLDWRQETFNSNRTMFDGTISAMIVLPTQLSGDTNGLRRVGSIIQRWMGGGLSLFDQTSESFVPGLVKIGYGATFDYSGLADYSGLKFPTIQITIPFSFDLELMRLQLGNFDPNLPLDDSDLGFLETMGLIFFDSENNTEIFTEGVSVVTGQTNA